MTLNLLARIVNKPGTSIVLGRSWVQSDIGPFRANRCVPSFSGRSRVLRIFEGCVAKNILLSNSIIDPSKFALVQLLLIIY